MLRRPLLIALLSLPLSGCETLMFANILVSCGLRAEPELLPESLPPGKVGEPYRVELFVIKTSTPVSRLTDSDKQPLPDGLRIEHEQRDSQGLIVGTPTRAGEYQVLLSAGTYGTQCAGLTATRSYTLRITD